MVKTAKNTADFEEEVVNKVSVTAMKGGEEIGRENVGPVVQKLKKDKNKKKSPDASRPPTKYDLYLKASQQVVKTTQIFIS